MMQGDGVASRYADSQRLNIASVTFIDNTATDYPTHVDRSLNGGGAAMILCQSKGCAVPLTMADVTAVGNSGGNGGAFILYSLPMTLSCLNITSNIAFGGQHAVGGGAIFLGYA